MSEEEYEVDYSDFISEGDVSHITVQVPLEYIPEYMHAIAFLAPAYNDKQICKEQGFNDFTYMQDLSRMFFEHVRETIEQEGLINDDDD